MTAGITTLTSWAVTACTAPAAMQITLSGTPASVPAARRFVREVLCGCPRADDLALAVTELATNAVAWSAAGHGDSGTFTVRVRTAPRWARIEVTDPGRCPARRAGQRLGPGHRRRNHRPRRDYHRARPGAHRVGRGHLAAGRHAVTAPADLS